jgi:hypothetical protein
LRQNDLDHHTLSLRECDGNDGQNAGFYEVR